MVGHCISPVYSPSVSPKIEVNGESSFLPDTELHRIGFLIFCLGPSKLLVSCICLVDWVRIQSDSHIVNHWARFHWILNLPFPKWVHFAFHWITPLRAIDLPLLLRAISLKSIQGVFEFSKMTTTTITAHSTILHDRCSLKCKSLEHRIWLRTEQNRWSMLFLLLLSMYFGKVIVHPKIPPSITNIYTYICQMEGVLFHSDMREMSWTGLALREILIQLCGTWRRAVMRACVFVTVNISYNWCRVMMLNETRTLLSHIVNFRRWGVVKGQSAYGYYLLNGLFVSRNVTEGRKYWMITTSLAPPTITFSLFFDLRPLQSVSIAIRDSFALV
jgi:hypothetical protein